MQKKLIALAVAAAVASPMAVMADVKISGKMHASWDWIDTDDATGDDSDDQTGVQRWSRIRFSGSEDLGNGLKTIWQIESQAGGASTLGSRNTWVGLAGNWGNIKMGRHDTPYKSSTGKLDIFGDTIADYNTIISSVDTGTAGTAAANRYDNRNAQMVMYTTPTFNGFKASIQRASVKQNEDTAGTVAGDDETEVWSMMAQYENGPFFAALAYEDQSGYATIPPAARTGLYNASGTNESDGWKLGLGYKFGNSKIGFVYEDIDRDGASVTNERDAWLINFAHKFGNNTFKIVYADADDGDVRGENDGADMWAIGLDHAFSKRTSVYVVYADMDNDRDARYGLWSGAGAAGTSATASADGRDVDALSFGIVHNF